MVSLAPRMPPKLGIDVKVRLSREDLEGLREIAYRDCTSVSCVVRRLVRLELRRHAAEQVPGI